MSFALSLVWLFAAGPVAGVVLAQASGALTGPRAALWAAGCQLALTVLYVLTRPMPVRSYGRPPRRDGVSVFAGKARFVVVLVLLAAAVAAAAAPVWRLVAQD